MITPAPSPARAREKKDPVKTDQSGYSYSQKIRGAGWLDLCADVVRWNENVLAKYKQDSPRTASSQAGQGLSDVCCQLWEGSCVLVSITISALTAAAAVNSFSFQTFHLLTQIASLIDTGDSLGVWGQFVKLIFTEVRGLTELALISWCMFSACRTRADGAIFMGKVCWYQGVHWDLWHQDRRESSLQHYSMSLYVKQEDYEKTWE